MPHSGIGKIQENSAEYQGRDGAAVYYPRFAMVSLRWVVLVVLLFLIGGCRSQVKSALRSQKIAAHEVVSFPLTINGTNQNIWVAVKVHTDAPVDAFLVLDKEIEAVVELVRKGQDVDGRILAKAHVAIGVTLLEPVPPESGVNLVLRNSGDKVASVSWEQ